MNFDSFSLNSRLLTNIRTVGYTAPTPIQEQAVPAVMDGRDVMGLAQTGTGKTAAFLLPILHRLTTTRPQGDRTRIRALVVAPTRELAEQIYASARELGRGTGIRAVTVYGGVGLFPQAKALRAGVDMVIACPGRLLDHVRQGNCDLSAVEVLVLDEADHMFDMGFLPDVKKIVAELPETRQTLLFSATMPEQVRLLTRAVLTDPVTVRIKADAPAATVSHAAWQVAPHLKTGLLLALLDQTREGSVLVFTRTKHLAKKLAPLIDKSGHRAACIQGNLSQKQRQAAMDGFRDGRFRVLVATDIAARGIDVSRVAHVVNFDLPNTPEAYTHRIGRTGRAERTGEAHTFVTRDDLSMLRAIERLLDGPMARRKLDGFDYDKPKAGVRPEEIEATRPAPWDRNARDRDDRSHGGQGRSGKPANGRGWSSSAPSGRDRSRSSSPDRRPSRQP